MNVRFVFSLVLMTVGTAAAFAADMPSSDSIQAFGAQCAREAPGDSQKWAECVFRLSRNAPEPAAAPDPNWVEVAQGDGLSVRLDYRSLSPRGQYIKAWLLWDFASAQEAQSSTRPFRSSKRLQLFDCAEKRVAVIQDVSYALPHGNGTVTKSLGTGDTAKATFFDVVPDTVGEATLKSVCAYNSAPQQLQKSPPRGNTLADAARRAGCTARPVAVTSQLYKCANSAGEFMFFNVPVPEVGKK